MPKLGIEFDEEAQKNLEIPLGKREIYPSTGKYIAEILREQGVTIAWGVPGGHIWQFVDSISRIGIKLIIFGHEQNSVYAAEAYSQVTQKPSVAFGTVGPGAANAFSPMQQAFLSNSPIIYLAGGAEQEHDKLYNTIQDSADATQWMSNVSKWAQRVLYPWSVKQFASRAFRIAQAAPKGPVCLELNCNSLFTKTEAREHYWGGFYTECADWIPNWRQEETQYPITSAADSVQIEKAAKAIFEAKSPFIIIGDYPAWDQAGPELEEFINLTKIPFNTRRLGRAVVSEKHPQAHRGFPKFRNEIDLMIPVGLKVGFFDGYAKGWPEAIQIAPSQDYVWTYVNTKATLMGNTKVVLKQLNECIKKNGYKVSPEREAWAAKCQKSYAEGVSAREARAYKYGPDHPRYKDGKFMHLGYMSQIIREVNEELYGSAVRVAIDAYTMSDFIMPYLQFTRPASCITANDQAGVGHGVGQAIGAAIGDLENGSKIPFLALMGDSGIFNAGLDIHVAVMYKLPIVYMVMNNGGWMPGMKYPWYGPQWDNLGEQDVYGNEWMGVTVQGEERPRERTDFTALCKMFGGTGMRCFNEANFREDLKKAYAIAEKDGPVIMDCIIDQHLVNKAVIGPVYSLMYAHIPWEELPKRGQHSRRSTLKRWFPALNELPEMPIFDNWEPLKEDEFTYPPKYDMFK